jgi:hypothetical protein
MKKVNIISAIVLAATLTACSVEYDEGPARDRIEDMHAQIDALEKLTAASNADIAAVRKVFQAVETGDIITSCVPFTDENGSGYKITFYQNGEIKVYNGVNGTDGNDAQDGNDGSDGKPGTDGISPVITALQDTDGKWYWAIDDDGDSTYDPHFLLDDDGNKVCLTLELNAGKDGAVPQLKIVDGIWYVSYDQGEWKELGPVGTSGVPYIFSSVKDNGTSVEFTLTTGQTVTMAKLGELNLMLSGYEDLIILPTKVISFSYTVAGATVKTKVYAAANCNAKVEVLPESVSAGTIKLTASSQLVDGDVLVYADNGYGQTSMRKLTIKAGSLILVDNAEGYDPVDPFDWTGGKVPGGDESTEN